jgi:hypothetical protein
LLVYIYVGHLQFCQYVVPILRNQQAIKINLIIHGHVSRTRFSAPTILRVSKAINSEQSVMCHWASLRCHFAHIVTLHAVCIPVLELASVSKRMIPV